MAITGEVLWPTSGGDRATLSGANSTALTDVLAIYDLRDVDRAGARR
jgi:hypothetical protein